MREECFDPARGDRPDAANLAIIITDGIPFPLTRRPLGVEEARKARDDGILGKNNFINYSKTTNNDRSMIKFSESIKKKELSF